MIDWKEVHIIQLTVHPKEEYENCKKIWPNMSEQELLDNSDETIDIDTIFGLKRNSDGTATILRTLDYYAGGEKLEVFEDYEELYDFLTSKSDTLKARLGKRE